MSTTDVRLVPLGHYLWALALTAVAAAPGFAQTAAGSPLQSYAMDHVWAYNDLGGPDENGFAVAAGDIDPSDPQHELVLTQPLYRGRSGRVLYFADVRDAVPDGVFANPRGPSEPFLFGVTVSVGDVNGDGAADFAVGERSLSRRDTTSSSGQVVVYLGDPEGGPPDPEPDLVLRNPHPGPDAAFDNFGDHVHIVSGPGLPTEGGRVKILVGARTQDGEPGGDHTRGAVYGYSARGELLWSAIGAPGEYLGKWVDTGDLDGSDPQDLLVGGARPANEGPHPSGGLARMWSIGPGDGLHRPDTVFDLPLPERSLGTGAQNLNFGYRVVAGDATGDGVSDLVVSDPYYGEAEETAGAVYLYEGPIGPGDLPEWILRGSLDVADVPLLGRGIDFGDLNGDGVDDFVVGAPAWAVWNDQARVYGFLGGPVSELPGEGEGPRVATAPAADRTYPSPEMGNMGQYAVIAPVRDPPGAPEDVVVTIGAAGDPRYQGAYLFPGEPETDSSAGEIRMRWLGNAGWEISDAETTVLVDPYLTGYSSETGGRREDGTRLPDTVEIRKRIPRADYVFVTHGHPDHVLDATAVARLRGATLVGHRTSMNIARAYGVPDEQLITVLGGEDYAFDGFSVRVIPSLHSALADKRYHNTPWPGEVPRGTEGPLESYQFKEGGSLAYLIRMNGQRVLAMGSMNFIEREMDGLRPTVALVGALESRREIHAYTDRLMRALSCPALVFPTHIDMRREGHRRAVRELNEEVDEACPTSRYLVPTRLEPVRVRSSEFEGQERGRAAACGRNRP